MRQIYELSIIAKVSKHLPGLLGNQAVLLVLVLVIILIIGGVIFPPSGLARERVARLPSTYSTASCGGSSEYDKLAN